MRVEKRTALAGRGIESTVLSILWSSPDELSFLTFLQYGVSFCAVDLLSADNVAGGVRKVDEFTRGVEIQSSGVHEVLDGNHVLIGHFGVHVHAPDDSRTAFPVHQKELVVWF